MSREDERTHPNIRAEKAARKEAGSGDTECDWDDLCGRVVTLCNDILERKATTIGGLAVQTRALGSQTVSYGTRRGRWKMHRADTIVLPLGVQRARRRAAAGHLVARRLHRRRRRARICLAWVFGSLRIRAMAKTNLPRPYSRGFFFGRRRRRAMTMSRRGVSTLRFFPTPSTQTSPPVSPGAFSSSLPNERAHVATPDS